MVKKKKPSSLSSFSCASPFFVLWAEIQLCVRPLDMTQFKMFPNERQALREIHPAQIKIWKRQKKTKTDSSLAFLCANPADLSGPAARHISPLLCLIKKEKALYGLRGGRPQAVRLTRYVRLLSGRYGPTCFLYRYFLTFDGGGTAGSRPTGESPNHNKAQCEEAPHINCDTCELQPTGFIL